MSSISAFILISFFPLLVLIFYFSFSAHADILSLSPSLSRTLCLWSRYCPLSHYQTVVLRGCCGSPWLFWTGTEWHSSTRSRYVPLDVRHRTSFFSLLPALRRRYKSAAIITGRSLPRGSSRSRSADVLRGVGVHGLQWWSDRSSCASKDPGVLECWSAIVAAESRFQSRTELAPGTCQVFRRQSGPGLPVRFLSDVGRLEGEGVLGRSRSSSSCSRVGTCSGASPPLGAVPRRQRLRLVPTWRRLTLRGHHRGDRSSHTYSERIWALSFRWFEYPAARCRRDWIVNGD